MECTLLAQLETMYLKLSYISGDLKPERVGQGGPILIHFDGWGNEYDYWAELDSTDLHPVGYCEMIGHHLQRPNGK